MAFRRRRHSTSDGRLLMRQPGRGDNANSDRCRGEEWYQLPFFSSDVFAAAVRTMLEAIAHRASLAGALGGVAYPVCSSTPATLGLRAGLKSKYAHRAAVTVKSCPAPGPFLRRSVLAACGQSNEAEHQRRRGHTHKFQILVRDNAACSKRVAIFASSDCGLGGETPACTIGPVSRASGRVCSALFPGRHFAGGNLGPDSRM